LEILPDGAGSVVGVGTLGAGAAAAPFAAAPIRRLSSAGGEVSDDPLVRMNAKTPSIASDATTAAPIAPRDR
jgi:hypothetical protein